MLGWIEMLRVKGGATSGQVANELERDVQRLERVASRFSKIGSKPVLKETQLAPVIGNVCDYMAQRVSADTGPRITANIPNDLNAPLNTELFEWVMENLLKNSLDAIEGDNGQIEVSARREGSAVLVDVKDNGKGIELVNSKNVFRPGYSTKKRGWGLGLSLAKRIIEDYHGGVLSLASSKPGEGTTFRIKLPLSA
jgi:signal transduction histidine kinase